MPDQSKREVEPLTPDEILNLALEKETAARDFYAHMAVGCTVDFVKELLERLQNEESKHVRMIRGMLSNLGAGREIQ